MLRIYHGKELDLILEDTEFSPSKSQYTEGWFVMDVRGLSATSIRNWFHLYEPNREYNIHTVSVYLKENSNEVDRECDYIRVCYSGFSEDNPKAMRNIAYQSLIAAKAFSEIAEIVMKREAESYASIRSKFEELLNPVRAQQ